MDFYGCFLLEISSTAFCRYTFLQVCLTFCCFNWLIRLMVYRSNHSITDDGIKLSGNFIMILKSKFSKVLCSLWNNSFTVLRFFISMSMVFTPILNDFCIYTYMIPSTWKIYNIHSENSLNYFFNIRVILLNLCVFISEGKIINSIKIPKKV